MRLTKRMGAPGFLHRGAGMTDKIVYIEWIDSACKHGWQELEQAPCCDLKVVSIGFLLKETDYAVTISAHQFISEKTFDSPMTIPRVAITNLYEVTGVV